MARKIKFLIVALFVTGLLFLFSSNQAHADEVVTQIVSNPAPTTDTATVTTPITVQIVETKINDAQSTLTSAAETQGNAIISTIQANVPNTDTATATRIAITQEPIKSAVESATVVIQEATTAIQSAQTAVTIAVTAQAAVESQTTVVAVATTNLDNAQTTLNNVTQQVESQTVVVATDTTNLIDAKAAADASVVTTTVNGVKATTYAYSGSTGSPLPTNQTTPLSTTTVPYISANWGSGQVLNSGRVDNVIVKYEGTITVPDNATSVKYAVYSDDGAKLYLDGVLAINNWKDQGPTWSAYSPIYNTTTDKQQDFVLWYYEHGGGANVTLGWGLTFSDGTGYWTNPMATAFSSVTTTKDPVLVATATTAQTTLTTDTTTLNNLQVQKTSAESVVVDKTEVKAVQVTTLNQLTETATATVQAADSLANTAITKVNEAVSAMTNAAQVATNYYAEQQRIAAENARIAADQTAAQAAQEAAAAEARATRAAELAAQAEANRIAAEKAIAEAKAAQEKAAAEAKAAEDARIASEQAAKEAQAAADKAKADAEIQAAKDAQAKADAAKAEADAKAKAEQDAVLAEQKAKNEAAKIAQEAANAKAEADKQKVELNKIAADQAAKDQAAKDAQAKVDAQKAADDKAKQDAIGVKPNNPDQLSDTVVKEAPKEILVAHIQQDIKGVENGGIQFFGTKSAPQVVGEDGNLTPPAPPPGSGLPIPADAITTSDTFIGQPGGTSFNSPDIAIPVVLTPVTGALASVPGVQAVNQAFVAMANIGNDMSPVTRKKAKKILVLTIAVAAIRRRFN